MSERSRLSSQEAILKVRRAEVKELMQDARFRNFILRLLANASIFNTTHRSDPLQAAFSEGRRALGLEILSELVCADAGGARMIFPSDADMLSAMGPRTEQVQGMTDDDLNDGCDADARTDQPFER